MDVEKEEDQEQMFGHSSRGSLENFENSEEVKLPEEKAPAESTLFDLYKNAMKRSAWRDNMALGFGGAPALILTALGVVAAYVIPTFFPGLLAAAIPSTVFGLAIPLIGGTALGAIIPPLGFALLGLALIGAVAALGYMLYNRSQGLHATTTDKMRDLGRQMLLKNKNSVAARALAEGKFKFIKAVDKHGNVLKDDKGQDRYNLALNGLPDSVIEKNTDPNSTSKGTIKHTLDFSDFTTALGLGYDLHEMQTRKDNSYRTENDDSRPMPEWKKLFEQISIDQHRHEFHAKHNSSREVVVPKNTDQAMKNEIDIINSQRSFFSPLGQTSTPKSPQEDLKAWTQKRDERIDYNFTQFLGHLEMKGEIVPSEGQSKIKFEIVKGEDDTMHVMISNIKDPSKINSALNNSSISGTTFTKNNDNTCTIVWNNVEQLDKDASVLEKSSKLKPKSSMAHN